MSARPRRRARAVATALVGLAGLAACDARPASDGRPGASRGDRVAAATSATAPVPATVPATVPAGAPPADTAPAPPADGAVHDLARGSAERTAVLDAARGPLEEELRQRVRFEVAHLRAQGL